MSGTARGTIRVVGRVLLYALFSVRFGKYS